MQAKNIGFIPARLDSTRFPKKLLFPIMGKSLLQLTYENARRSSHLSHLIVAACGSEIFEHVQSFSGEVVLTDKNCHNGSERIADALTKYPDLQQAQTIVVIQGDEPCIDPGCIDEAIKILLADPQAQMSTVVTRLKTQEEAYSPAIVKCVVDQNQNALYFSRAPIPSNKHHTINLSGPCYRHIGLYVYRPEFLLAYRHLAATPLQTEEDLEQLKVLEHGYRIKVAIVENVESIGVDLPEDIKKVEKWLCKQNIS